jgi:uncharacterized repeat protein (TIGR03803 family)
MGLSGCEGDDSNAAPTYIPKILYSFDNGSEDHAPLGGNELIQGSDGNFYGTTNNADVDNGTIFTITPAGAETVLHSFTGAPADASSPTTYRLIQGTDSNFYGTTLHGGANDAGIVFKLTPAGVETVLYSFGRLSLLLRAEISPPILARPASYLLQVSVGILSRWVERRPYVVTEKRVNRHC